MPLLTGQYTDSKWGVQLQRLIDEYCCLHAIKARLDLKTRPQLESFADVPQALLPLAGTAACVNWLSIAVCATGIQTGQIVSDAIHFQHPFLVLTIGLMC